MVTRYVVALIAACAAGTLHAGPFADANPDVGKKRFDEAKCNGCHVTLMEGNGDRIFTRPERKIKDPQGLLKMVRFCVDRTGAGIFPEDVAHIAAYLNHAFYKFK